MRVAESATVGGLVSRGLLFPAAAVAMFLASWLCLALAASALRSRACSPTACGSCSASRFSANPLPARFPICLPAFRWSIGSCCCRCPGTWAGAWPSPFPAPVCDSAARISCRQVVAKTRPRHLIRPRPAACRLPMSRSALHSRHMSIVEKQEQVLEELALFPDWTERYEYVIGLGKKLPPIDPAAHHPGSPHQRLPVPGLARRFLSTTAKSTTPRTPTRSSPRA